MALLEIQDLRTWFYTPDGVVRAVDGVDLDVEEGEALGLVGESGSGKSVLNLTVLGLVPSPPASIESGRILFEGRDLLALDRSELRKLRGDRISMIFQDPMTSLNPFLTIGEQVAEPLLVHRNLGREAARRRAAELLREVGIPDAERRLDDYPHQFSGGMRQRVMIAMAIACEPKLLIADEPTTALDVTIQAQILDLLGEIRRRHGTTVILITHDLGIVAGFCDRLAVMYAGRIVERGPTEEVFRSPAHPYTQALLDAVPRIDDPPGRRLLPIPGAPPDLAEPPPGCRFHPRCAYAFERCRAEDPVLEPIPDGGGRARACFASLEDLRMRRAPS